MEIENTGKRKEKKKKKKGRFGSRNRLTKLPIISSYSENNYRGRGKIEERLVEENLKIK